MLVHPHKLADLKWREELLEFMESSLKNYQATNDPEMLEVAKSFGALSEEVGERIERDEYTPLTPLQEKVHEVLNQSWNTSPK